MSPNGQFRSRLNDPAFKGVPSIERAIINIKEKDDSKGKKGDKELLVEGYGLQKVMTTEGAYLFPHYQRSHCNL